VQQRVGLILDRGDDRIRRVPEVQHPDAAGKIDVLLAVHVDQSGTVRMVGDDRCQRHATGDVGVTHRQKRLRSRSNLHCHGAPVLLVTLRLRV
jgi:hypothetical protein